MFRIIDILQDFVDRQTGVRSIMIEGIADTAADLPQNTEQLVYIIGSYADVIDTGNRYKINSAGQWIQQPSTGGGGGGDTYTKAEIDQFLADKQDLLTWAQETANGGTGAMLSGSIWSSIWGQILGLNTFPNLADGDDLNDFTTVGIYRCTNSSTAANLVNMPSPAAQQAGGRLVVLNVGGTGRYLQLYMVSGARFWLRSNTGTGWLAWYEYAGYDNYTNYQWGRYTVEETTGNVTSSTTRLGSEEYFAISGGAVLSHSAYASGQALQSFYLFYDSNQTYLGNTSGTGYIGWVDCGVPVKVPSAARLFRIAFRKSGNATITPAEMIKCIRQTG